MAVKKSELYSSIWAACDQLRGGMDASQYKDYVLFMLFIKYISDKYAGQPPKMQPVKVPAGATFDDMVALKGKPDIGDRINKRIIQALVDANKGNNRISRTDFPDFNDSTKLGEGKAMVDRLTNLIAIFQKPELDFSKNRAQHDDILGDAYEYLMQHFASESGKSKGQFYTPAEVSMVLAKVLGIGSAKVTASTTAYDPTCGSASLLLKIAAEAGTGTKMTLEGQEMDVTTAGLARINMILHDFTSAVIMTGNTLSNPKFLNSKGKLRQYDFVAANPPFSVKTWSNGVADPDPYERFSWGRPPEKQGDYAFLLHIIESMKPTGKGAVILPHGVLFRGNAESVIRANLVRSGILKGIIGLPANLFYGTGIPACILVLDKEGAADRRGVFMIDASRGFMKDGNKNRLRQQDMHRIVDTFDKQVDVPGYSRMVSVDEIADPKNGFNLNIPRYVTAGDEEIREDLEGHLYGGIPASLVDRLAPYWAAMPGLKASLFKPASRAGYFELAVPVEAVHTTIAAHPAFTAYMKQASSAWKSWRKTALATMQSFGPQIGAQNTSSSTAKSTVKSTASSRAVVSPKDFIHALGESILAAYAGVPVVDRYAVYQHLMDYWNATMQDDAYTVSAEGWKATPILLAETAKKGAAKSKGWSCDLLPKDIVVKSYFSAQASKLDKLKADLEAALAQMAELEEEHGGEEGFLGALTKIAKGEVKSRLKAAEQESDSADEVQVLAAWLEQSERATALKAEVKAREEALDAAALAKYPLLTPGDVIGLVVEQKWLAHLEAATSDEVEAAAAHLSKAVTEAATSYDKPVTQLEKELALVSSTVSAYLRTLGVS